VTRVLGLGHDPANLPALHALVYEALVRDVREGGDLMAQITAQVMRQYDDNPYDPAISAIQGVFAQPLESVHYEDSAESVGNGTWANSWIISWILIVSGALRNS